MTLPFNSRRSNVLGVNGSVSSHQPLASQAGHQVLLNGGNAVDACIAMAGVLAVTEPFSNGLGGDVFCLYYDNTTKKVKGFNGSGKSPSGLTYDYVNKLGFQASNPVPEHHGLTIMVPGAPAAYVDILETFGSGKMDLATLWQPAVSYAENGFPVSQVTAYHWKDKETVLMQSKNCGELLLKNGAPRHGDIMTIPTMATTLKEIISKGKRGFYEGKIAEAIVREVKDAQGVMELSDLSLHTSSPMDPITTKYKNVNVWETGPNTTGLTALMVLNILEEIDMKGYGHNSANYLHTLAEAIKLSFADVLSYVCDPELMKTSVDSLLSKKYAEKRRQLISLEKAGEIYSAGTVPADSDTTYFTAVDERGNACSMISSVSGIFGSGRIPEGCGFVLNNRGRCFSLQENNPNVLAPNKRPLNTIIPAMITDDSGELLCSYGIMGGFMQPQAHVQVLLNMLEFGMSPQDALNASRLYVLPNFPQEKQRNDIGPVYVEEGISEEVGLDLKRRGHNISPCPMMDFKRLIFGKGHVISRGSWWSKNSLVNGDNHKVLWTACDPRCDGTAIAF